MCKVSSWCLEMSRVGRFSSRVPSKRRVTDRRAARAEAVREAVFPEAVRFPECPRKSLHRQASQCPSRLPFRRPVRRCLPCHHRDKLSHELTVSWASRHDSFKKCTLCNRICDDLTTDGTILHELCTRCTTVVVSAGHKNHFFGLI